MTKLWPEFDAFVNDLVNVWEGDSIENVLSEELTNPGTTAEMIEDEFRVTGELPTFLDPNIEIGDQVDEAIATIRGALDMGLGGKEAERWWPLSIPLTAAVILGLVVISR